MDEELLMQILPKYGNMDVTADMTVQEAIMSGEDPSDVFDWLAGSSSGMGKKLKAEYDKLYKEKQKTLKMAQQAEKQKQAAIRKAARANLDKMNGAKLQHDIKRANILNDKNAWKSASLGEKAGALKSSGILTKAFTPLVAIVGALTKGLHDANKAVKNYTNTIKSINAITSVGISTAKNADLGISQDLTEKVREYKKARNTSFNFFKKANTWTLGEQQLMQEMLHDLAVSLTHGIESQINAVGISSSNMGGLSNVANKIAYDYAKEMHPYLSDLELKLTDEYAEAFQNAVGAGINGGSIKGTAFSTEGWQAYAMQYGYVPGMEYTQTAISDMQTRYLESLAEIYEQAGGGENGWKAVNNVILENKKQTMILDKMANNLYSFDEIIKVDAFSTADTIDEAAREMSGSISDLESGNAKRSASLKDQLQQMMKDGFLSTEELDALLKQGYDIKAVEETVADLTSDSIENVTNQVENNQNYQTPKFQELKNALDLVKASTDGIPADTLKELEENGFTREEIATALSVELTNGKDSLAGLISAAIHDDGVLTRTELANIKAAIPKGTAIGPVSNEYYNKYFRDGNGNLINKETAKAEFEEENGKLGTFTYNPNYFIDQALSGNYTAPEKKSWWQGVKDWWNDALDAMWQMSNPTLPSYSGPQAHGGIATAPTLAMVAEAGSDEAIIPLNSEGIGALSQALQQAGSTGSISVTVNLDGINIADDDRKWEEVGRRIGTVIENNLRRTGSM